MKNYRRTDFSRSVKQRKIEKIEKELLEAQKLSSYLRDLLQVGIYTIVPIFVALKCLGRI